MTFLQGLQLGGVVSCVIACRAGRLAEVGVRMKARKRRVVGGGQTGQWPDWEVVARFLELLPVNQVVLNEGRRHGRLVEDWDGHLDRSVHRVLVAQPPVAVHGNEHGHAAVVDVPHHALVVRVRLADVVADVGDWASWWWGKAFGVGQGIGDGATLLRWGR